MKKIIIATGFIVMAIVLSITISANSVTLNEEKNIMKSDKRILVVCYSFSNGNTRKIAKQLQEALNADYAEIEPVVPYPPYGGWNSEVTTQGKREVETNFHPEIKPLSVKVADYDVIAIGTPTWWFAPAPVIRTFLNSQNWQGKVVIPFMTHGGWPGKVIQEIKESCEGAKFAPSMEIQFDSQGGSQMHTSQTEITNWIEHVKQYLDEENGQ